MTKPIVNEQKYFDELTTEKAFIPAALWDIIYRNIEDSFSAMELLVTSYIEKNKDIPLDVLQQLSMYAENVNEVFSRVINPQIVKTEDGDFIRLHESRRIHKNVRILLGHYIGNAILSINLNLRFHIDEKTPMSPDMSKRMLGHILSIGDVLERIRKATETDMEKIREKLAFPIEYLSYIQKQPQEISQEKLADCLSSLLEALDLAKDGGD